MAAHWFIAWHHRIKFPGLFPASSFDYPYQVRTGNSIGLGANGRHNGANVSHARHTQWDGDWALIRVSGTVEYDTGELYRVERRFFGIE